MTYPPFLFAIILPKLAASLDYPYADRQTAFIGNDLSEIKAPRLGRLSLRWTTPARGAVD